MKIDFGKTGGMKIIKVKIYRSVLCYCKYHEIFKTCLLIAMVYFVDAHGRINRKTSAQFENQASDVCMA